MVDTFTLFGYVTTLKHRYFETLAKLSWEELNLDREASFHSIRNVFLHIVNVEDSYINYILAKQGGMYVSYDFSKFNDMAAIRKQMYQVEAKTIRCLSNISAKELEGQIEWTKSDGTTVRGSCEDVIAHLSLEQIHHFGELICLLWHIDAEPPHLSFLQYLEETQEDVED